MVVSYFILGSAVWITIFLPTAIATGMSKTVYMRYTKQKKTLFAKLNSTASSGICEPSQYHQY